MLEKKRIADTEWWFYHVRQGDLNAALVSLTCKCRDKNWRVLIISPDAERRDVIDKLLWTFDPISFIPHGQAEAVGLDAARQPVLIAQTASDANRADVYICLDSAQIVLNPPCARCITLFDDHATAHKDFARQRYQDLMEAGKTIRYFQQDDRRRWVEKN